MPRYTRMLAEGMKKRGHYVEVWTAEAFFYKIAVPFALRKWLGYLDQYIVFPRRVKKRLKNKNDNTIFVFIDHALGPWVPLVHNKPHVVHCHDFLAQNSAFIKPGENNVRWTGRKYQAFIRRGYSRAKNFISVSEKTRKDLHRFITSTPLYSEVVYNGFHQKFSTANVSEARKSLGAFTKVDLTQGYILHVGGNQWYKNKKGVIDIYSAWRSVSKTMLPLIMIGEQPDEALLKGFSDSPFKENIFFITDADDNHVQLSYAGATVLLFPSLAEGFGWPIAEAMASGCPVITTNEAPMTEVGGNGCFYIPKYPAQKNEVNEWAKKSAKVLDMIIQSGTEERKKMIDAGLDNAKRFDTENAMNQIESIYLNILRQKK